MVSLFAEETNYFVSRDKIDRTDFEDSEFQITITTNKKNFKEVTIISQDDEVIYDMRKLKSRMADEPDNCLVGLQNWFDNSESEDRDAIIQAAEGILNEENYAGIHIDYFIFGVGITTLAFHIMEKLPTDRTDPFDLSLVDEFEMYDNFSTENFKQLRYISKIFERMEENNSLFKKVMTSGYDFFDLFRYAVIEDEETMIFIDLEKRIIEGLVVRGNQGTTVNRDEIVEAVVSKIAGILTEQIVQSNEKNEEAFVKIAERFEGYESQCRSVQDVFKQSSNLLNRLDIVEEQVSQLKNDPEDNEEDDSE